MDAGRRPGIIPAITLGMIPGMTLGIIGTTPGTMAITDTTAVGIRPGITEATIAPGDIGDGMDHATMPEATTVRTATINDLFAAILLQATDPIAMEVVRLIVEAPLAMALR